MPLSRYQIRNEYSLADPELFKAADKDDPEALLEGVAMAGLVGVLRQLGDLAEFAAEIFHDLHEEVMVTAARGHGLLVRVQQLESEFPSVERAFLSQTGHSPFFSSPGIDWHPNLQTQQNLITRGDLPRFVMDSYEECRGPPRLFLLDKFDVAGAGACLKRYTDPSFYKVEASPYELTNAETQRDRKIRKTKKKGSRWKNGGTPDVLQPSHVKLHQLLLEERVQNGVCEPARRVKLKKRQNKFPFDSESGRSYMEKLLNSPSEDKLIHEVPVDPSPLRMPTNSAGRSGLEIPEVRMVDSSLGSARQHRSQFLSPSVDKTVSGEPKDNLLENIAETRTPERPTSSLSLQAGGISSGLEEVDEKHISVDGESKIDGIQDGYQSDDVASETDNYVDALTTMELEIETDAELRTKSDPSITPETYPDTNMEQLQSQVSDSQSVGNSNASDDGNSSIRKGITSFSYSETTIASADNTSPGGAHSPQSFACTEIPFRPRVSANQVSTTDKIPVSEHPDLEVSNVNCIEVSEISNHRSAADSALLVDQGTFSKESTSRESDLNEISSNNSVDLNSPRKTEEHQVDLKDIIASTSKLSDILSPTTDNPTSFTSNPDFVVDNEDDNASSSPVIHLPNVLDTTHGISENSLSNVSQTESEEENHTRNSVDSQCSSPHSVISHVEVQPFGPALEELDICDPNVKPSEATFRDDIPAAEETSYSPDTCSLPKGQSKEIGDDVLVSKSDSAEAGVSYSSEDETELNDRETVSVNSEIKVATAVVSDPADVYRNGDNGLSTIEDEKELEDIETESVKSETKAVSASASGPEDVDSNEGKGLSNLKEDTELEKREAESINLETEAVSSAVSAPGIEKNEGDRLSTPAEPDENGLVINESSVVQNSKESGEKAEVNQQSVVAPELEPVPCDPASYDHSNIQLLDSVPKSSLDTCDVNENDVDKPSANLKILQGQSHSIIEETDQNGPQTDVSPDVDSHPNNIVPCDQSNVLFLDSAPDSSVSTEAKTGFHLDVVTAVSSSSKCIDQDSEYKSPSQGDHTDKFEAASSISSHSVPPEENVDQVHMQSLLASGGSSQLLPQLEHVDSQNHVDHETHLGDMHSESYPVNLESQSLEQEEEVQGEQCDVEPTTAVVASCESTPQYSSESYPVPASEELSMLELLQSGSNVNLSDQVTYPSAPVFSGFGMLPQSAPINFEEMPPLPPLPPMQWRMGKASLTSRADNGQHSAFDFPPIFPSAANEEPQMMGHPSIDENRNQSNSLGALSDTENQKSQRANEDLGRGMASSSRTLSTESSLHAEEHDKSSEVNAVKLSERIVPQPASEREQSQNVPNSGRELFWPSSTSLLPPVDDERPTGIRPMKIHRPRSPLIDAVAAHDKSKLRKVSELAKPQIPKEEERDTLLEQIRAKSFNLKPAVQTRPSIQGPTTNLRVAAILEKANAIRQALAGSDDDDDDDDNWSDS